MGKGGRFGKYGEQKKLERLRQKQRSIAPLKSGKKFPERRPMDHQKGRDIPCLSAYLNDAPQITPSPIDLR
jgi:hypothetical protein